MFISVMNDGNCIREFALSLKWFSGFAQYFRFGMQILIIKGFMSIGKHFNEIMPFTAHTNV